MSEIFLVNSASFQDFEVSASLRAGPSITVDFSNATVVKGAFSGSGIQLSGLTASYIVVGTNITSSNSSTASYVKGSGVDGTVSNATTAATASSISFIPTTAVSASWVSASNVITSASFATNAANAYAINFIPAVATSASWVSASNVITSASFATTAAFASTVPVQATATSASWVSASNVITSASYSTSSSLAINATNAYAINFVPIAATSASWVSASNAITSASYAGTSSFLTRNRTYEVTASWAVTASNAISASYALSSSNSVTASYALQTTSASNAFTASYALQATSASNSATASLAVALSGSSVIASTVSIGTGSIPSSNLLKVNGNISCSAITASSVAAIGGFTGSLQGTASVATTASYALTASYLLDVVYSIQSAAQTKTGDLLAIPTSMSVVMQSGSTWVFEGHCTAQSNNNRGLRWAISASNGATFADVEGQIIANTSALTAFSSIRINAVNSVLATSVDTQANVAGASLFNFVLMTASTDTTISLAIAVTNTGDTATVQPGSYFIGHRVR